MKKGEQALIRKRGVIKARLTRFQQFIDTFGTEDDVSQLKVRLTKAIGLFEEFDEVQAELEALGVDEPEDREQFEDTYYNAVALADNLIDERTARTSVAQESVINSNQNRTHIKLPTISLQQFHGKYDQWVSFHDNFVSLIHDNTDLSNVQKLHYLKSSLCGDASNIIHSLESTNQNYDIAWSMLKERFENKKLIIQTHVNSLFNIAPVTRESYTLLRQLSDNVSKQLRALKALNEPVDHWDTLIIHIVTSKLDNHTKREWESVSVNIESPKLNNLTDFLKNRCQILEALESSKQTISRPTASSSNASKSRPHTASLLSTNVGSCFLCNEPHHIYQCEKLLQLSVPQRISEIQKLKLCLNCLRNNHTTKQCRSTGCKTCSKKHNSLLHLQQGGVPEPETKPSTSTSAESTNQQLCSHSTTSNQVLLATALVNIFDVHGKSHVARVLLDAGSQTSFITTELANKLHLQVFNINSPIAGINQTNTNVTQSLNATIRSRTTAFTANLTFMILNKITSNLPVININVNYLKIPTSIQLADPTFYKTGTIDILLGAEIFWDLMSVGQIKLAKNQPFLQKTQLGWIVSGRYISERDDSTSTLVCNLATEALQDQLTTFWTIEHDSKRKYLTREEQCCEDVFSNTTKRTSDGRFVVTLPFKTDPTSLGQSKEIATKRFLSLEKKLQLDLELKTQYSNFMNDYLKLGHMEKLTSHEENVWPHFYLPHHAVFKPDSTTTKLRVVFDGSCKSSSGVSLNDCLLVGPQKQEDLLNIITRFRTHKYVITADIVKMYRQIQVAPEHTQYQRILWRNHPNDTLETYKLSTVTYGTASASYLAIRSLQQTAHEHQHKYPEAASVIIRDFYVDDLITGVDSLENGIKLIKNITSILKTGGFELRKWNSNERTLLFPNTAVSDHAHDTLDLEKEAQGKILGLTWTSTHDILKYSSVVQETTRVTKRVILARIARIFDPLGLLGPVIIKAKLLLQKLWQLKSDWDESVPEKIYSEWVDYNIQLNHLNNLPVPRRITQDDIFEASIHGFCDSSEAAYGACLYLWTVNQGGTIKTALICGKSRVAPLKHLSLPRLELCGAQLLVHLYNKIMPSLGIKVNQQVFWTDSKIVLAWIQSESKTWKTFIANRVGDIQEHTSIKDWRHVRSEDNPADLLSRGVNSAILSTCDVWWNGPYWLRQPETNWPAFEHHSDNVKGDLLEERKIISLTIVENSEQLLLKYSTYQKLQRVISYCFRFINNMKNNKRNRNFGPLHVNELNLSTMYILKTIQHEAFPEDINHLKKFKRLHKKSNLLALNPFLDENDILRVGGRMANARMDFEQKHPIILPPKHHVTNLLIVQEHIKLFHAGAASTLANMRHKYWPISGLTTHLMGNLPRQRVDKPSRAFVDTGIDYCGPILIREGHRKSRKIIKAYVAVFVCFATKATHLEIVLDSSTEAFISALKRFMSRRGKPSKLYSDNGTNFVGADRQLKELLKSQEFENAIIEPIQQEGIEWSFIPPRSPHFGGLWEATVKSFKLHFKRTVGNASLNYEELLTIAVQIEACLNSRPITPISSDPNDLNVLTPSHFLIGGLLTAPLEHDVRNIKENRLTRWQRVQQITQHFWSRWSTEYLTQLQRRTKWKSDTPNTLQEGSMVILKDDQQPPLRWPIGRVISVLPGKDGIIRAATVRTSRGNFLRATAKLCLLPIDN